MGIWVVSFVADRNIITYYDKSHLFASPRNLNGQAYCTRLIAGVIIVVPAWNEQKMMTTDFKVTFEKHFF